ncbi:hypothetical protein [Halorussus halobius]|uniref:hypothetical protein n=1 Tax=Halorussus halobius TaxID=1710537 RepID=UPI001092D9E2|nr:hypothetical protein [Halorussus halobius]
MGETNEWGGPTDDAIIAAVRHATSTGQTDLLEGGVPPVVVADLVGVDQHALKGRLRDLVDEDRLVRVRGADPESYRARWSYLHPEDADFTALSE